MWHLQMGLGPNEVDLETKVKRNHLLKWGGRVSAFCTDCDSREQR
jgi:hypothetical protein